MEQLDKWNKEMRRLSVAKFAETDDALYNYYKGALKDLKAEVKQYIDTYETLSFSKRLEVDNRLKMANRIDAILNDLNQWSDAEIRRYIENEMEVGYYGTWYALEGAENVQLDFGMLPENYIETLVNQKVNGQTFSKRLYAHRDELAERVTTSLLNNAVNGKGYAYAAKEVGELTEASYKQALRIALTEGGRAQSTAKQKAYKEAVDNGVKMEKRWLSTLDKKTRHSHQELDGQTVAVDGKFKFDGSEADGPRLFGRASLDINCRCTTIAVVNGIAPEVRKDNLTGENIAYTNYNDWRKSKAAQAAMGKQKYADYVGKLAKKYGTNDFSKLLDRMTDKEYEQLGILDITDLPEEVVPAKVEVKIPKYKTTSEAYKSVKLTGIEPEYAKTIDERLLDLQNNYPVGEGEIKVIARKNKKVFGYNSTNIVGTTRGGEQYAVFDHAITISTTYMDNLKNSLKYHEINYKHRGSKLIDDVAGLTTIDHEYAHAIDTRFALAKRPDLAAVVSKYATPQKIGILEVREINAFNKELHGADELLSNIVYNKLKARYGMNNIDFHKKVVEELGTYAGSDKMEFLAEGFANARWLENPSLFVQDFKQIFDDEFNKVFGDGK